MLIKSARAKGKRLENFVAKALQEYDKYAYRRADSGSGLHRKEDVFTVLPIFIECKNHSKLQVNTWWKQTLKGCPANKMPVLIYKKDYQRDPYVVMYQEHVSLHTDLNLMPFVFKDEILITMEFRDFLKLVNNLSIKHNE